MRASRAAVTRNEQLAALATRHAIPTIHSARESEERIAGDHERTDCSLHKGCKGGVDLTWGARVQDD
jgi:hypothetical protein